MKTMKTNKTNKTKVTFHEYLSRPHSLKSKIYMICRCRYLGDECPVCFQRIVSSDLNTFHLESIVEEKMKSGMKRKTE